MTDETASLEAPTRVLVLGIGNVLMGDDGLGPWVVRRLAAAWDTPPGLRIEDGGTAGADLLPRLDGLEAVVIVDAIAGDGVPGEVRVCRRDEILQTPQGHRTAAHQPGLREALLRAELAGCCPREVTLVGAVPGRVALGTELSRDLVQALPAVEAAVRSELERLGTPLAAKVTPQPPDLWWRED